MTKDEMIEELKDHFGKLDEIRKDLIASKDAHVEVLKKETDYSTLEALKDWQNNFAGIINAMDSCTKQIRALLSQE